MKTTIDSAGRVVIPKKIRDATHLLPGAEIEVRVVAGAVQLEPAGTEVSLERSGGFVVAMPRSSQPPLTSDVVRRTQEEVRDGRAESSAEGRGRASRKGPGRRSR